MIKCKSVLLGFSFLMTSLGSGIAFSAPGDSLNVDSLMLYKLKKNERIIHADERRLHINAGKTGYILFTERIEEGDTSQYMIQNGKAHGPYDEIFDPEIWQNYNEKEFYHFIFHQDGKRFVNMDGQVFGPYDKIGPRGGWYHLLIEDREHFLFTFERDSSWWVNVSGTEFGPYKGVADYYTTYSRDLGVTKDGDYFFRYDQEDGSYCNINGKEFGPYNFDPYKNFFATRNLGQDFFTFSYKKDDQLYVNWNGEEMGPYKKANYRGTGGGGSAKDEEGHHALEYETDKGKFLFVDGEHIGPIEEVRGVRPFGGAFAYKMNGEWTVRLTGMHMGPYEDLKYFKGVDGLRMIYSEKDGEYTVYDDGSKKGPFKNVSFVPYGSGLEMFVYQGSSGKARFYARNKSYGPYKSILTGYGDVKTDRNGNFAFWYKDVHLDGNFLNVNGTVMGPFDNPDADVAFFNRIWRVVYKKEGQEYVNVLGEEYGPYEDVMSYQYQSKANSKEDFYVETEEVDETGKKMKYVYWKGKKKYGPFHYSHPNYDKDGQFILQATKDDKSYVFNGKKVVGPYDMAQYTPYGQGYNYHYKDGDDLVQVTDGKKVKMDGDELRPKDYTIYGNEAQDTVMHYSQSADFIEYNSIRQEGFAKNSFGWTYNSDLKTFYWLSLNGRKLYMYFLEAE